MAEDTSVSTNADNAPPADSPLKRFEPLIGRWNMTGRTLDSQTDNISGWTTFQWMFGGFIKSEGGIRMNGFEVQSLEIIAHSTEHNTFPSTVYSTMSGDVFSYEWDVQGNTLIHKGLGATYTGAISDDGNTIIGGWRPDEGTEANHGTAYDAIMTRVQ